MGSDTAPIQAVQLFNASTFVQEILDMSIELNAQSLFYMKGGRILCCSHGSISLMVCEKYCTDDVAAVLTIG